MTIQRMPLIGVMLAIASLLGFSTLTMGHEQRPAIADVRLMDDSIEVSLRLNLEALISGLGESHDDTPQAERYEQLRTLPPNAFELEFESFIPSLLEQITVLTDTGAPLELRVERVSIADVGNPAVPRDSRVVLISPISPETAFITWQWAAKFGQLIIRRAGDGTTGAGAAVSFSELVQPGQLSGHIPLGLSPAKTSGSSFIDYVLIGFDHIIPKGLDHVLFVIALFLLTPKLKPLLWQVTTFTLAHSVTLALGITGVVTLPASIVEPLIALSIVLVCVENAFYRTVRWHRLGLIFLFGLLHGLGFAGVLGEIGLEADRFFWLLLAFNLGVELGQLSVIALCWMMVGWLAHRSVYRSAVVLPGSLLIGGVGLFWFIERLGEQIY